ncbi:unnamed protein product [Scytosiphon promiscuus]
MPIPEDKQQQQQQQKQQQKQQQPPQEQASGVVVTPASSARPQPWAGTNNVELDSREDGQPRNQRPHEKEQQQEQEQQRHQQPAMVIVADDAAPAGGDAGGAAAISGRGAASGAEIPMSPPSSPTHVATVATASQDERAGGSSTVVPGPQPGATETSAGAEGEPAPHPPGSGGTTTKPPGGAAGAGGDAPAVAPPVVPVRLGRGRKLCPSCKALTKSAVKQCRECKHVFNPASSRLRAQQQHLQPKENEVPALPRRRHRPSQRLLESLVVASPSSSARRPLAASNTAGGGNQSPVTSHKRKVPLPPGQQRVAEDLLASPAPARHVLVPESPELAPMASPAGPLLSSDVSVTTRTIRSRRFRRRARWRGCCSRGTRRKSRSGGGKSSSRSRCAARREFHLPGDAQERDPFAGVEMTWWDGGEMSGTNPAACVPTSFPMVGRDGTMEQVRRSAFSLAQSTELLGDTDDALLWNPLRASSSNETHQYSGGPPGAASRSLTLWPGSSNSDTSLLMSAAAPPAESRSPSPENSVFPNFARGAAIASAAGATGSAGGSKVGASNTSASGGSPEFLLAESSCSSLPGPLVFGDSGASGWPPAAAAVTADSADGEEEGGFWSPP